MLLIQYPEPGFRIREENGRSFIFDDLRKKWLLLTPEEWVRRNLINYLVKVKQYPATLVAQEKMLKLGELNKRFDILVYDEQHRPWMMVECKASTVPLNEKVLQQLLRYHISIPVGYLVIGNGPSTYAWEKKEGRLVPLDQLPDWPVIL
ncbi:MAG: type I restriction enzyme HsdR N-terminal domain-containing protein [Chitinophagaceae bacterium]|nr:MAG: type I restriction enzyme HsdR N-terminal domain-containing protein [Chitinophagaceae bacterium]